MTHSKKTDGVKVVPFLLALALGIGLWMLPYPEEISPKGWKVLAVFAATIFGIMTKALPMGAVALLSLSVLSLTETLTLKESLNGFANPVVWLVVMAFFVAKSFIKTGLGYRIAYLLIGLLGKRSLGLAYGMALTDLAMAPAIPSNTARGGGILFPIIESLALTFESSPQKKTQRKIGAFLMKTAYHANIITSTMFLTAMAANPMMAEIARGMGLEITWGSWALAASVPGIVSLLLIPWLIYVVYPPEIKETPAAAAIAHEHLHTMGGMTLKEKVTLGVFSLMLLLWIFGPHIGLDSTTIAMTGVAALLVFRVLTWKDITEEKIAWDTLIWFATLLMMAAQLTQLGVIAWISDNIQESVQGVHWAAAYILLVVGYFYSHYFFASNTAHASSMYAAITVVGMTAGVPPYVIAFSLAFCTNLSACITHYGTGPGPIYYGAGYVDLGTWWKLGGLISIVHLAVWIGLGTAWWKLLGYW